MREHTLLDDALIRLDVFRHAKFGRRYGVKFGL